MLGFVRACDAVHSLRITGVFGLHPSSSILETRKHVSETGSVSVLRLGGKAPTLLGPLERANLSHLTPSSESFGIYLYTVCL
jgi:hypothetical protein